VEIGGHVKIGIVGAGAMGCVYGGILGDRHNEVWLFDVWKEHIEAIQRNGLKVQGASGDRVTFVNGTTQAKEAGPCDLCIVATKTIDTEAAVKNAGPMIGPQTLVLSIQNGIGNVERMEKLIGQNNLLIGVAEGFGASVIGPAHVHHNGWEMIHLGECKGGVSKRLKQVAAVWKAAGFKVSVSEDIRPVVWGKLVCNVGFSPICAVSGLRIGQVINNPHAWHIAKACAYEAAEVARAKRIALPFEDSEVWVRDFGSKIPEARPSMLLDLNAGRRCEIDSINGAVAKEGAALGIPTPVNVIMTTLVKAMEERGRIPG
jgi:2-dehydropantoate 2-reductase